MISLVCDENPDKTLIDKKRKYVRRKPSPKWSLKRLNSTCKNNNIKIYSMNKQDFDEDTIHVFSRIKGKCNIPFCENSWNKEFRQLANRSNYYCKTHSQSGTPHFKYIKFISEINKKLLHINVKFKKNYNVDLLTLTDTVEYNCLICKKEAAQTLRYIYARVKKKVDIYIDNYWTCSDCTNCISSVNRKNSKEHILLKNTQYFKDLYEVPSLIDYITTKSSKNMKFKCNCPCPKCGETHEYFERMPTNLDLEIYSNQCNKCKHPNKCKCMKDDAGFICTTCKKYFPDKKVAAHCGQICIECRYHHNDEDGNALKDHICHLLANSRKKNRGKRKNFQDSDLDYEKIYFKLKKQNNICFISKIQLSYIKFTNWRMSIERLDENIGYLFDNTALVCLEFQSSYVQWTPNKWNKFCQEYDQNKNVNIDELKNEIENAKKKPSQKTRKKPVTTSYVNEEKNEMKCNYCYKIKNTKEDFNKSGIKSHKCKQCCSLNNKKDKTLRVRLKSLLYGAKQRGREKKRKTCTLTFDELCEIYLEQQGLCNYSNKKLELNHDYRMSLERKNNKLGYTKDNCCLICLEFNVGEWEVSKSKKSTTITTKTSGWNKEKIKYAVSCTKKYHGW
tara:strand:+ start:707 stop:2557 length:1851 start_codon:yes stop_codon:yes gene_type:complete